MGEENKRKAVYDYSAQMRYRRSGRQKQISLSFLTQDYERYKKYADSKGMKFREFIITAIEEKIERG